MILKRAEQKFICKGSFNSTVSLIKPYWGFNVHFEFGSEITRMQGCLSTKDEWVTVLDVSDSPNWIVFQPNIVIDAKLGMYLPCLIMFVWPTRSIVH